MMVSAFEIEWGIINAGGVIAAIPSMVFFIYLQKYLIEGLTAGAVKG
jgi:multiple sugar transport system permease protein